MKNTGKVLGLAVIAASVCSADALGEYLDSQPVNRSGKPIKVAMKANETMLNNIADVIVEAGKYVSLDLSGSPLTTIGENAFDGCKNLVSVTIPASVTNIGTNAFVRCENLTSVTIPAGVTSIGNRAFSACTSLTSITIPNSVTSIGEHAFGSCVNLTGVTIGNSVTSIGEDVFHGCTGLSAINVDANNSTYLSDNGILYNKAKTTLIKYPKEKTDSSFTIPNSVIAIGDDVFSGCTSLTSITIPDNVILIGNNAFNGCTSLTSITMPDTVILVGNKAFFYFTGLISITIPNSVADIETDAFANCSSLTSVTFEGTINSGNFCTGSTFPGDLRDKYFDGGPGTYTLPNGSETWTKQ
jgi:hypothetical protein